jgi:hypothetical protein
MDARLISRIIRFNRTLSWILVILALITIFSGYGITRDLFYIRYTPQWFLIREVHLWFNWFFILLLVIHIIVIEGLIKFKWIQIFRNIRNMKIRYFLWLRVLQRFSGYTLILVSIMQIVSGLSWYTMSTRPLPLHQHIRFEVYLIALLIIHTALGAKMVFYRRKFNNILIDISIFVIVILAIIFFFSIDRNLFRIYSLLEMIR